METARPGGEDLAGYELLLRAGFSAAHQLRLGDGRLEPLHGHNWRVEVFLTGSGLDESGLLADFTVLQPRLQQITGELHDTFLNEHPAFASDNPSTELIAKYIHDGFAGHIPPPVRLVKVRVWETDDCAAAYVPGEVGTDPET